MSDEMAVAHRVFALTGESLSDDGSAALSDYLEAHQRGRLGRVHTSCEMLGLDEGQLRRRFARYTQRFLT